MSAPRVPAAAVCPRCGRQALPGAGPFCSYCGRYLAPLQWVAEPPPSTRPPGSASRTGGTPRYTGPPRYPDVPRWGFPPRPWTVPEPHPAPPDATTTARALAGTATSLLWATAVVALLAAAAETWRYVLLLASREGALSAGAVAASDAFVVSAGTVAPVLGALAGAALIGWSVRAATAAAEQAGVRPPRSARGIVVGWLVPGLNLAVPGSVLAEIEHALIGRPAHARPRPSRLLRVWWVLWAAGVVLAAVVLAWSLRDGVQAAADAVVLHAVL
ncbi:MAG TPA: DUF4328 domain-containing protein, partial [Pseudonocardia sp.]|nr:DUF4328 domain-containing protein [Pseudonocardia sp.]